VDVSVDDASAASRLSFFLFLSFFRSTGGSADATCLSPEGVVVGAAVFSFSTDFRATSSKETFFFDVGGSGSERDGDWDL